MNREDLVQELIESLAKLRQVIHRGPFAQSGSSPAQFGFLALLFHHPNSTVNEIAARLGISKSAVTQLADPLVEDGLVSRRKDEKDRRIVRLALTNAGSDNLKRYKQSKIDGLRTALDNLSDQELAQLVKLHNKITTKGD